MWKKHKTSKLYLDSADSLWWFMLAVMKVVRWNKKSISTHLNTSNVFKRTTDQWIFQGFHCVGPLSHISQCLQKMASIIWQWHTSFCLGFMAHPIIESKYENDSIGHQGWGAKILGSRTSCLRILKVSHESQRCFQFVIFKTSPTNMAATNAYHSIKLHITQYHSLWLSAFIILIRVDATMLWSRLLTCLKKTKNPSLVALNLGERLGIRLLLSLRRQGLRSFL